MTEPAKIPPVDMETYVPAAITLVRRSQGWPGFMNLGACNPRDSLSQDAAVRVAAAPVPAPE